MKCLITIVAITLSGVAAACGGREPGSPTSPTAAVAGDVAVHGRPPVGTMSQLTASAIGPELQAQSCSQERSLRSISFTTATRVEFVNESASPKRVYWLSYTGERVRYHTLLPRWSVDQPTYLTHPWVVTDEADNCLAIYMPATDPRTVVIRDVSTGPQPLTMALVAASLAQEIHRSLDAAVRTGLGIATIEPTTPKTLLASLIGAFLPTPVHAQTFGGFAPCRAAGTVSITGSPDASGRRVSFSGAPAHYSTCTFPLGDPASNRFVTFSGSPVVNGTWTADSPTNAVTIAGSLEVDGIGIAPIECTSLSTQHGCHGRIGGITTGRRPRRASTTGPTTSFSGFRTGPAHPAPRRSRAFS